MLSKMTVLGLALLIATAVGLGVPSTPAVAAPAHDDDVTSIWSTGRRSVHIHVNYEAIWVAFFDGSLRSDAFVFLKENISWEMDRNIAKEYRFSMSSDRTYDFDVTIRPEWFDGKREMDVFAETWLPITSERYRSSDNVTVYR
jgi:hypothetical protein